MAVEVIGRDVEYDGDLGAESLNGFQLKAGNFEHSPRFRRCLATSETAGVPMLPPTSVWNPPAAA